MTHPTDDLLLLAAYGELAAPVGDEVAGHVAGCVECRERFARFERTRVALVLALRPVRRRRRLGALVGAAGALVAAAVLAFVLLRERPETGGLSLAVPRYAVPELAPIDSLLTRLEQGRPYGLP
jgi:hypothetical protein